MREILPSRVIFQAAIGFHVFLYGVNIYLQALNLLEMYNSSS